MSEWAYLDVVATDAVLGIVCIDLLLLHLFPGQECLSSWCTSLHWWLLGGIECLQVLQGEKSRPRIQRVLSICTRSGSRSAPHGCASRSAPHVFRDLTRACQLPVTTISQNATNINSGFLICCVWFKGHQIGTMSFCSFRFKTGALREVW
jgi:hypothetical protein